MTDVQAYRTPNRLIIAQKGSVSGLVRGVLLQDLGPNQTVPMSTQYTDPDTGDIVNLGESIVVIAPPGLDVIIPAGTIGAAVGAAQNNNSILMVWIYPPPIQITGQAATAITPATQDSNQQTIPSQFTVTQTIQTLSSQILMTQTTPISGTYTIFFKNFQTDPIPFNANATTLFTQFANNFTQPTGTHFVVTGGPLPTSFTITVSDNEIELLGINATQLLDQNGRPLDDGNGNSAISFQQAYKLTTNTVTCYNMDKSLTAVLGTFVTCKKVFNNWVLGSVGCSQS